MSQNDRPGAGTIPPAELQAIAERYDDIFEPDGPPTVRYVRWVAGYYRAATLLMRDPVRREALRAEAAELDALADRHEPSSGDPRR